MGTSTEENECKSPDAPDGFHEPDWSSVYVESDGGEVYIDVNCKHCGSSGCIGTASSLGEQINW